MASDAERLIKLETQMDNIEKKMDEGFRASEVRADNIEKLMKEFIEKSESKYASKWVEKVLVWGGSVIGGAILISLMALILRQ